MEPTLKDLRKTNEITQRMLDILNKALAADPQAIQELLDHRVHCNNRLADLPHVIVSDNVVVSGNNIGALGLLNGLLSAAGLPKIAAQVEECKDHPCGEKIVGFQVYAKP